MDISDYLPQPCPQLGPVETLTVLFIVISLLHKSLSERIDLFVKSNWKYRLINSLSPYIYYGPNLGVEVVLKLDSPTEEVFKRRIEGQKYLASKLGCTSVNDGKTAKDEFKGPKLASSLVDCRFALAKVCMPLLRELEFDAAGRNFIVDVKNSSNGGSDAAGMLNVITEDSSEVPYVGNDAVHTMGKNSFYEPIQREITRRMEGDMFKYCPIAMNSNLERNVELIKELTGMDQVSSEYRCFVVWMPNVKYSHCSNAIDFSACCHDQTQVRYSLSGSEAVDAALKDIRATTSKLFIVRFTSAYHGHTSGINFLDCDNHIFLPECSQDSIDFIEKYHYRIAAVIVNPMQHFTGVNKPSPPGEKVTYSSRIRESVGRNDYARWLHQLQTKCTYCTKYLTKVWVYG